MGISLHRVWLVALRDYLGYVKTWGFWISFLLPVAFGALGFLLASNDVNFQSTRYEAVLDTTNSGLGDAIRAEQRSRQDEIVAAMSESLPESMRDDIREEAESRADLVLVDPPADTLDALMPYLRGDATFDDRGIARSLDGVLEITRNADGAATARYWSRNINAYELPRLAERVFRRRARGAFLEKAGLSLDDYDAATRGVKIDTFDPTRDASEDAQVSRADRLPFLIAAAFAGFLWLTVFSGAYMLLTSMLEEKLGKLMEMMLASTRFSEIMLGKLLGVAMLTLTAFAPYILLAVGAGILALTSGNADIVTAVREFLSLKMLVFFPVFLVLGYVFYGSLFIALGSLSESMQDAQTLTVPIMIVLTACLLVVPLGINDPESPLLALASWIPLSAPFASIARLPSDPSWFSLMGSAVLLLLSTLAVGWIASRIFRHGVLSGVGVKGLGLWLRRTVLRQNPTS